MGHARSALTRREFVQSAVAGAGAVLVGRTGLAAPVVHTAGRSGLDPIVLGSGAHQYECIHDWLKPPPGVMWGDTHGLAQDSAGRIYVAHTVHAESSKPHAVAVYGENGAFETAWGDEFRGGAHGLDVRTEAGGEFLYHCDTQRRLVVKTDLAGTEVWRADCPMQSGVYASRDTWCPTNVAFAPDGGLFVGDGYGSSFVHRYTAGGEYVSTVLRPGGDKGQVACPHGLWVDDRAGTPRLAVADRGNRRIQYFSLEGEHQGFVTAGVRMPCHFKTRDGLLLVPDLESVVTLLDRNDAVVAHLGDGHPSALRGRPREEFIPGKFIHPHTAIFLRTGDILVAEWVPIGRITLLRRA
ncbi:MAG: hypothetical protein ACKVU4_14110 [Phycisphaerales bacterium]